MTYAFNRDCNEAMKEFPDKFFDLAIVDPPYGIGISGNPVRQKHEKKDWDDNIPNSLYFTELFRISNHQIIWGGNYYNLQPSQGFIIWDKKQPEDFSLAMCEFAWISFQSPAKIFEYSIHKHNQTAKIHPTQKPVALYKFLLKNYAKEGDKILDTHLGSGSSRIAAHDMGFDLWGYELDKDYFEAQEKRFKQHIAQLTLFTP